MSLLNTRISSTLLLVLSCALSNPATSADVWDSAPQTSIQVEITTHLGDQQQFRQGDRISFLLSLDREAYIYLLYRDAAGTHLQLLPNQQQPTASYPAGVYMPIPAADAPFQFVIQAPYGEENLWVLASSVPWPTLSGKFLDNGLFKPADSTNDILARYYKHIRSTGALFGQARLRISTRP